MFLVSLNVDGTKLDPNQIRVHFTFFFFFLHPPPHPPTLRSSPILSKGYEPKNVLVLIDIISFHHHSPSIYSMLQPTCVYLCDGLMMVSTGWGLAFTHISDVGDLSTTVMAHQL